MENNTQSPQQSFIRRLIPIGIALVILVVVIALTIVILKNVIPQKVSSSVMSVNADETVALYGAPKAITGLSENLYDQQINDGTTTVPIIYKLPDQAYAVSTLTPQSVLFYSKNQTAQNDTKAIQDQTNIFMKAKGYERVANSVDNGANGPLYATYASDDAVCQLISSGTTPSDGEPIPVSYQLACAEKDAVKDEYGQVEKLLKLYNGKKLPSFTVATRTLVTEGDKSLVTLSLRNKSKSPNLLFAAVHDSWSYVADLNGSDGESNGKYVITPDVKTKLANPKYGDFLTRYIIGTGTTS